MSTNDNLSRALENIPNEKERSEPINNLIDGLKMVQKEFTTILEKNGIKRIKSLDTKFDPDLHQAMMEIGALICLPSNPKCLLCPMNNHCRALQQGTVSLIPLKPPKKKVKILYKTN